MEYQDINKQDEDIDLEYRLNEIYNDISLRINQKVWAALFDSQVFWDMEKSSNAEEMLFDFLCKNNKLPEDIWKFIDKTFKWSSSELDLYKKFNRSDVDLVLKCIKKQDTVSYRYLEKLDSSEVDRYIDIKEKIAAHLDDLEFNDGDKYIGEAEKLCADDPELIKFKGVRLIYEARQKDALKYFYESEKINGSDADLCLRIACLLHYFKEYDDEIKYLNKALALNYKKIETVYYTMAVCYYMMDNIAMARKYFYKSLIVYGRSCDKFLRNIDKLISGKTKKKIKFKTVTVAESLKKENRKKKFKKIINRVPKWIKYPLFLAALALFGLIFGICSLISRPFVRRKKIKKYEDLKDLSDKHKVGMTLKNIQATGCYKLKDSRVLTEEEIDEQNLWLEVKSGIYYGTINKKKVLFSDCKIDTYHKDDFELKGRVHVADEKVYKDIIDKYDIDEDRIIIAEK